MTITRRSFTKAALPSTKTTRRYGRNRALRDSKSQLLNPRPSVPPNILIETMDDAAVVVGGKKGDTGTIRNAAMGGSENGMETSLLDRTASDTVDGDSVSKSSHDDERRNALADRFLEVDASVADGFPDNEAPLPECTSNHPSKPPTKGKINDNVSIKKNSNHGSKRPRLNGSYVLDIEISDRLITSSNQAKSHKQTPAPKTCSSNHTTYQASALSSKANSNPKSIGTKSNKSLNDVINNSIFPNNSDKSKEGSVSKSSSHTKSKSTGASSSTKKSIGVSATSTAKTKNTMRILTPTKKLCKSKFQKGKTGTNCRKQMSQMEYLTRKTSLPPPVTVTVCAKKGKGNDNMAQGGDGGIDVWEDREDDDNGNCRLVVGVPTKRKVLHESDVANRVNRDESMPIIKKDPLAMQNSNDKYRTKSARKKRKSGMEDVVGENKRQCVERDLVNKIELSRIVHFKVPMFEAGRYGEDKFQERKYLGLIEGVGGGIEEKDINSDIPHRGRLLELAGEVMPGAWKAHVLQDTSTGGLPSLRISLRHNSVSYSSLEDYLYTVGGEVSVSVVNPLKNRVKSFINQGILNDDEIDDEVDGEERVLNGAFMGCISIVWFGGFTSASEAVNLANDVSENLLKLCVPVAETEGRHELCKLVTEDKTRDADELVTGVLFRTKLDFNDEYLILVSHREFEIDAVDVIFKKIEAPPTSIFNSNLKDETSLFPINQRGLTPSLLSKHLDEVGSSVEDIMDRFQGKRLSNKNSDYRHIRVTLDQHDTSNDYKGKPNKSMESDDEGIEKSTSNNDVNHDKIQDFGETTDIFERDVSIATKHAPSPVSALADQDLFQDDQSGVSSRGVPVVEFRNAGLPKMQSTSPVSGLDTKTLAVVHSLDDAITEKCSAHNVKLVLECAEVKCADIVTPLIALTEKDDDNLRYPTPLVSNKAKKAIEIVHIHDENQLEGETTCKMAPYSPSCNEVAKNRQGTVNMEKNVKDKKLAVGSDEQVAEHNKQTKNAGIARGHCEKYQEPLKDSKPSGVIHHKTSTRRHSFDQEAKSSSYQVYNKKRRVSAPSERKDVSTPVMPKGRRSIGSTTNRKSTTSLTLKKPVRNEAMSLGLVKSSTKKKRNVYVCDLFGENESLFGCPATKTPAQRKSKASFIEKDSRWSSSARTATSDSPFGNTAKELVPSIRTNSSLETSLTGTTAVKESVSLGNEEDLHDTACISFEVPNDQTPVKAYSSNQNSEVSCARTMMYSPERSSLASQSVTASIMNSPDSRRGFHDYYYGQEQYVVFEDYSAPINEQQPLHDVYFGQDELIERLSSTTSLASLGSPQALDNGYLDQKEVQSNDHGNLRCFRWLRAASRKLRHMHPCKLHLVLLLLWGMLPGAMYTEISMRTREMSFGNSIFTKDYV